ncbi:YfzA family protein [Bacillus spongiae]|uniref:YfzA family protein n=1 Tax=Bacillus spongiae TaxID=2683610 RepID=A0ABU8HI60_9BACI
MANTGKAPNTNLAKRWMITIGLFLIVQLIFIVVDGNILKPNINDSDVIAKIGRWILDSGVCTIHGVDYPLFLSFF